MSEILSKILAAMTERYGPPPDSFTFGDGIDWSSPIEPIPLYVELPFWLMIPAGDLDVEWRGTNFRINVMRPWSEVFIREFTDSRVSNIHQGPLDRDPPWEPPAEFADQLTGVPIMRRRCKTMLRLNTRAHLDVFREVDADTEPPRALAEQRAYLTSLCEAHIPVVNELIQRYRLLTYDYFAYEVSAWDVPVWYAGYGTRARRVVLLTYKEWDDKPTVLTNSETPGGPPQMEPFTFAAIGDLEKVSSADVTPGEPDLLDARNLMERGDYTGALRRAVTAIEAVLEWALHEVLKQKYSAAEAEERLHRTDNDFPGRLRQWRKLATPNIRDAEFEWFEQTRQLRHQIVHRGLRLTFEDRGRAEKAIDTSRWLYNKIENKPDRARVREQGGILRSVGRTAMSVRFPSTIGPRGITVARIAPLTGTPRHLDEP